MLHKLYLLVANLFERAATYDEAWRQLMARRGLSFTIGLAGPAYALLFCVVGIIAIGPAILMIYIGGKIRSEVWLNAAVIYASLYILIVFGSITFLTIRAAQQYFKRRKMIKDYAAAHPNR